MTRSDPLEEFKLLPLKILEIREDPNGKNRELAGINYTHFKFLNFRRYNLGAIVMGQDLEWYIRIPDLRLIVRILSVMFI